jgi:hypothetical protein
MKYIGISGLAGSGKDTFASAAGEVLKQLGYMPLVKGFAEALKLGAWAAVTVDDSDYAENIDIGLEEFEALKRNPDSGVRELLQGYGMFKRFCNGQDYWIKELQGKVEFYATSKWHPNYNLCIIPDVRFNNEREWLLEQGATFYHVVRQGVIRSSHASENGFSGNFAGKITTVPNHGTKEQFQAHVRELILQDFVKKGV